MDTRAVAEELGTDPKVLRRFIRDAAKKSLLDVEPVGSGGRYVFTSEQVPMLKAEFDNWTQANAEAAPVTPTPKRRKGKRTQAQIDAEVWDEEGVVVMPDIRKPEIRRAVRAKAQAREARLTQMLMDAGLHISQQRDRVLAS